MVDDSTLNHFWKSTAARAAAGADKVLGPVERAVRTKFLAVAAAGIGSVGLGQPMSRRSVAGERRP